jgi:acetyl-CoA synthetase
MLGVVPSMVKAWQASNATAGCDWSNIRRFSSTGEASDPQNMLWLMSRAHYAPVIEYCGGTEIAGSFLSSTVVQPNVPSMFSTPVLGSNLMIMDENGEKTRQGEIALIPPALGLSTRLLNRDHHECYYDGMPTGPDGATLRRHGDEVEAVSDGVSTYYRAHGRCDDTMNLGGIKVSSIEIERVCNTTTGVHETAAVALNPPLGGPSFLVLFVVLKPGYEETATLKSELQYSIKTLLNPLFHVTDVVVVDSLPRTASNKIMRRILRDQYKTTHTH